MKLAFLHIIAALCLAQAPLSITTTAMARGTSRQPYLQTLAATGGTPPYTFAMSGNLLDGLVLEPTSGLVSGTPSFARCCVLNVTVQDSRGIRAAKTIPFIIDPSNASLGLRYALNYRNGGVAPYSCELVRGFTPPGLQLQPNCAIDGVPVATGAYNFHFRIVSSDRVDVVLDQTITVLSRSQQLLLSQSGFTFATAAGAAAPPPQTFRVINIGTGTLGWSATTSTVSGEDWLRLSTAAGTSTGGATGASGAVTVTTNPAGLAPGDYYGQVTIASPGVPNSPQSLTVVLTILPGGGRPDPVVSPRGLSFAGAVGGTNPAPGIVSLTNPGTAPLTYTATAVPDGAAWFAATPLTGTIATGRSETISIQPSLAGQAAGVRTGTLRVQFAGGALVPVALQLVVTPAPGLATSEAAPESARSADCQPLRLLPVFTSVGASLQSVTSWPTALEVRVVDNCAQPHLTGSVLATFSNNDPPLAMVSQRDGNWSATWTPRNSDNASVTLTATARSIDGSLVGVARFGGGVQNNPNPPPLVASGGVLSASSFQRFAALAPGNLVSIFGTQLSADVEQASTLPLPSTLGGSQVLIGGQRAPLLFSSAGQINAMLPFDLTTTVPQQIIVRRAGAISVPETVILSATQPGIFTQSQTGSGQAIVAGVRADGTSFVNGPSAPLRGGDVMVIYASGLGRVDNPVTAGEPSPGDPLARTANPVSVLVGDVECEVLFAGLTPGFVGLYQINAKLPANVPKGSNVAMLLNVGGQSSPPVSLNIE